MVVFTRIIHQSKLVAFTFAIFKLFYFTLSKAILSIILYHFIKVLTLSFANSICGLILALKHKTSPLPGLLIAKIFTIVLKFMIVL